MKKPKKTRYCAFHHNCDREEDCINGEYCPVFRNNPDTFMKTKDVEVETLEDVMDDIWEGN